MKAKKKNIRIVVKAAIFLIAIAALTNLSLTIYQKAESILYLPVPKINTIRAESPRYTVQVFEVVNQTVCETTAYNAGDRRQTDGDPCIASDGSDICKQLREGEKICAANFVPLGTLLYIEGFGICTVKDRMNSRYSNGVDVAMKKHKKKDAKEWGKKPSGVKVLKTANTRPRSQKKSS